MVFDRIGWIAPKAEQLDPRDVGEKAALLSRAAAIGLPVPPGFTFSASLAGREDFPEILANSLKKLEEITGERFGAPGQPLILTLRASSERGASASVPAVMNIGLDANTLAPLAELYGERTAADLSRRAIQSFGTGVLGLEGEDFEYALHDLLRDEGLEEEADLSAAQLGKLSDRCLDLIADEGADYPETALAQLTQAIEKMVKNWKSPRAGRRRIGRGAGEEAPLTLIVQQLSLSLGEGAGAGIAQLRDTETGAEMLTGRYLSDAQGDEAMLGLRMPRVLTEKERRDKGLREPSLEEVDPETIAALKTACTRVEAALGDAYSLDFTINANGLSIVELRPAKLGPAAVISVAVTLAERGAITRDQALLRVDPGVLEAQLHPSIDPSARREIIGKGLPASPGAASGPLVFSADAAESVAATGRPCLLALVETSPEDIRGMHAASAVLTVRGGMTSHAAVVARGLGTPCVVGAGNMRLNPLEKTLTTATGDVLREGDVITVDGAVGEILAGEVPTRQPDITGAFATLLDWADQRRSMGVRANAEGERDATVALGFAAEGIGLCRTEHMFFEEGRIATMRRMIMAESEQERRDALGLLLPVQRSDFVKLFRRMAGMPVVVRLLDPPLHEFLPHRSEELDEMARELNLPVDKVKARAEGLAEFNPMLGKRGCRIGIAFPEIYEVQARAIFEAACDAAEQSGKPVVPEIMIPFISAVRELDLLRKVVKESAREVREARGTMVDYTVGVMIETPRACLRAGEIAQLSDFLSFGTNDLTQMLYGLSRDDAGRFMPDYVSREVFPHDPFHRIDEEGVGEMIRIAIARARAAHPGVSIGLCGEHGGDPVSVDFCQRAGVDYVSCSPFRLPVARLAAAQAAIRAEGNVAVEGTAA